MVWYLRSCCPHPAFLPVRQLHDRLVNATTTLVINGMGRLPYIPCHKYPRLVASVPTCFYSLSQTYHPSISPPQLQQQLQALLEQSYHCCHAVGHPLPARVQQVHQAARRLHHLGSRDRREGAFWIREQIFQCFLVASNLDQHFSFVCLGLCQLEEVVEAD